MAGAFTLNDSLDLLEKLESDYQLLSRERGNAYLAFNFFVTAEHMLDWIYPGYANKSKRRSERESEIVLQVCSHLANGAKHFIAEARHHNTVSDSNKKRRWNPLGGPFVSPLLSYGGIPTLYITLEGDAEAVLGRSITALKLAELVLNYWKQHDEIKNKIT